MTEEDMLELAGRLFLAHAGDSACPTGAWGIMTREERATWLRVAAEARREAATPSISGKIDDASRPVSVGKVYHLVGLCRRLLETDGHRTCARLPARTLLSIVAVVAAWDDEDPSDAVRSMARIRELVGGDR